MMDREIKVNNGQIGVSSARCGSNCREYIAARLFGGAEWCIRLVSVHACRRCVSDRSFGSHTDGDRFLAMNLTNPSVIKVKVHSQMDRIATFRRLAENSVQPQVKACDAVACQGNQLKSNAYKMCGGKDDRVSGMTSKEIHFNANTTYLVFSNGVGVKEYHIPKTGAFQSGWPCG